MQNRQFKMPFVEFNKAVDELNEEIYERIAEKQSKWEPVYDGALSRKDYFESPLRIMWLMKEPYDTDGGGWHFEHEFSQPSFYNNFLRGGSKPTWQPVTYVSDGLLNGLSDWDDIENLNPGQLESLKKIAWVNIQKLPSKNGEGTTTIMEHIYASHSNFKNILTKQIQLLDPHVIICGGTFNVVCETLKCDFKRSFGDVDLRMSENNTVIIDAYHPAQRKIKREAYVNDILLAVNEGLKLTKELAS